MKRIEISPCTHIDIAYEQLRHTAEISGEVCYCEFNGKKIYSTDSIDDVYKMLNSECNSDETVTIPTEELLRLTRENNAMLTEIHECAIEIRNYIRWLQTSEYQDAQDVKQFTINAVANIYIYGMEEEQKRNIGKNFDKANNKNSEPQSRIN